MEVSNWIPPPAPPEKRNSRPRRKYSLSPAIAGSVGTFLVHGLVLSTVLLGYRAVTVRPPDRQGSGSMNLNVGVNPLENLVLIDFPAVRQTEHLPLEELASLGQAPKTQVMTDISADPVPHVDISEDAVGDDHVPESVVESGDPTGRARLFGLYTGQIQARVARAWRKPRTPVDETAATPGKPSSEASFQCQVEILQDIMGNVQEVLLPNCHGSVGWQRSLVIAIQQSSPLPAPPDPSIFSRTITLDFVGFSYGPGAEESEYEIAPIG